MRYDTPVHFELLRQGDYDPNTGDYLPPKVESTVRFAAVSAANTEVVRLIYGQVRQGILSIHLQNHFNAPFDRIRVRNKLYHVDFSRELRFKQTFIASEVT